MRVLLARVAGLFRQKRRDRDLDDEVAFHLALMIEAYQRRGLAPDEARRAANRHFGGVTQMKEAYRDQRGFPAIDGAVQDLRYGVRTLLKTPGFTAAILATLALGIGANAAIFSVVNAVLLRPLPYPEPDRLVQLVWRNAGYEGQGHTGAHYLHFRDRLRGVSALAATSGAGSFNLVNGDRAEFINATYVSREYFAVFGIQPIEGRGFTEEEDRVGGPAVVMLTEDLWRRQFGSDPDVVGRSVLLGDTSFTVVGVMPESIGRPTLGDAVLPLKPSTTGRGSGSNYTVVGRLRADVSLEQASAEADSVYAALRLDEGNPQNVSFEAFGFIPLQEGLASTVKTALLMMLGAVALLLTIACANTAGLLLARASGRGREMAVRAALGASRARIVRQMLTESVMLALAGASIGVLLAHWTLPALLALTPPAYMVVSDVSIDRTVLLVTAGVAIVTGLLFGLAPALNLSGRDLVSAFKHDGVRSTGVGSARLRSALVVGEVALCMLLLVGAGLLIQTFVRLRAVDPGFDPGGVLTARMSLQSERYSDPETLNRFYELGLERIRQLSGVRAAAVVNGLPIERALNLNVDVLDGPEKIEDALTDWRYATPDYFRAMGIPIVAGRGFLESDRKGGPPVAVVSEEFARRFFQGTSALGHHIRVFKEDGALQIVGIARDLKESGLRRLRPLPVMYVPVAQTHAAAIRTTHSYFQVSWVVRADSPGASLNSQIDHAIRSVDSRQPFSAFRTMDEVKNRAVATERFQMTLLTAFAAVGLLLAAAGIYGLLAYTVSQRTREFGIRMALGATRARILRSVIGSGAGLAITGVAVGTVAALAATRTLQGFVWNVSTVHPPTFITVAVVLIAVAAAASLLPALRAVRLDPVKALRE